MTMNSILANGRGDSQQQPFSPVRERRPLSVLFSDLVGSTHLLSVLGEEDYAEILGTYHSICTVVIREHGGLVAHYQGDGVVCHFGYPHASEDDAERAIAAALEVSRQLTQIQTFVPGLQVASRIGIASGNVIFDNDPTRFAANAVGVCLNKAARLEALADVGGTLICHDTRRLVGNLFELSRLDDQTLKGFSQQETAFRVIKRSEMYASRFEALRGNIDTPLINHENEMARLFSCLEAARDSKGQALSLVAEPGIGKSKLISALQRHPELKNVRAIQLQCSPEHTGTALHPVKTYLEWMSGVTALDQPGVIHDKLQRFSASVLRADEEQQTQLLAFFSPTGSEVEVDGSISVSKRRRVMFSILSNLLLRKAPGLTASLLVVEDIHWADPSTLELLTHMASVIQQHSAFLLVTSRPEPDFLNDFLTGEQRLILTPLAEKYALQLSEIATAGTEVPADVRTAILAKSDGVPLFTEEYTRHAQDTIARGETFQIENIPLSLNSLIQSKLDRLETVSRNYVQAASALGRTFSGRLVQQVIGIDVEQAQTAEVSLLARQLIFKNSSSTNARRFSFTHSLVRDAVYTTLSRQTRYSLHDIIVKQLRMPEHLRAGSNDVIASHLAKAGRFAEAAEAFWQATNSAANVGNAGEAFTLLGQGLNALDMLPVGPERDALELKLRMALASIQRVTRGPGNPAFGKTLERVRVLLDTLAIRDNLIPVIYNTASHAWATANLSGADASAHELRAILEKDSSDAAYLAANTSQGLVAWHRGENEQARRYLQATVARYDPLLHRDLYNDFLLEFGVFGNFYLGLAETVLGHTDAGAKRVQEALAIAHQVERPHAICFGMLAHFMAALLRGDVATSDKFSQQALAFATEQGFPEFMAMAMICQGWVHCQRAQSAEGLPMMRQGFEQWAATGLLTWQPIFAALEARCLAQDGQYQAAEDLLDCYEAKMLESGELQAQALIHLARAEAHFSAGKQPLALEYGEKARAVAQGQQAQLWVKQAQVYLDSIGR